MISRLKKENLDLEESYKDVGFTIRSTRIGDGIQFTSLPENYYNKTGKKLIDVSKHWYFNFNPYVLRHVEPKKTIELWNYPKVYDLPLLRKDKVYLSNSEIHASVLGVKNPTLIRPRLYAYEDHIPFSERTTILFHPFGISHGSLPNHVIKHVLQKYKGKDLYQIGLPSDPDLGISRITSQDLWELASIISRARLFIGVDSGPSWIAACYPDVVVKKVRTLFQFGHTEPEDWVPLSANNPHSFWDDRGLFQIFNTFEEDVGFTYSYKKL